MKSDAILLLISFIVLFMMISNQSIENKLRQKYELKQKNELEKMFEKLANPKFEQQPQLQLDEII